MVRYIIEELYRWKKNPARKPLVLQGARQVGKTWLMQQFAREAFQHHIYINFENNELLRRLFDSRKFLFVIVGRKIDPTQKVIA